MSLPPITEQDCEQQPSGAEADELLRTERRPRWDWTLALPDTEHVRFLKSIDWAKTRVGPIAEWTGALRQATYQVIADSRPATLYWYVLLTLYLSRLIV
jgi:hypothetical protein